MLRAIWTPMESLRQTRAVLLVAFVLLFEGSALAAK
jgi:hypothetical protein